MHKLPKKFVITNNLLLSISWLNVLEGVCETKVI